MSARDGGPAFPRPFSWDESPRIGNTTGDRPEPHIEQEGMSLRAYFAGLAMQGILAAGHPRTPDQSGEVPKLAIAYADALIRELAA